MNDESQDPKGRTENRPWYGDPDALLDDVRESGYAAPTLPQIDGYTDLEEIQRGGQGVVYKATQASTHRTVAVKVLLSGAFATETERRRFEREIELVAALRHANIVRVYDSGITADERLYLVMEFVEGKSLVEWVPSSEAKKTPPLSVEVAVDLMTKICDAVHYAHRRGVMHRDIKPNNIRVDGNGDPHVLDFGLAKSAVSDPEGNETPFESATGEFVGSLPWASPEQAAGDTEALDIRTDVYSLGVTLFQLLTGEFPYEVAGPVREVLNTIVNSEPRKASLLRSDIDDDLETILSKSLQKSPERRYQSAGELGEELQRYRNGEPIEAKRDSRWYVLRKVLHRHRATAMGTATFMLLLLAFGTTMFILYTRASEAERVALESRQDALDAANRFALVNEFLLGSFIPRGTDPDLGHRLTVREGVDDAAKRIDGAYFADKPDIRAELHLAIGYWYGNLGMQEEKDRHHLATLSCRREAYGERHPRVADHLLNLGWWSLDKNEIHQARDYFAECLSIREAQSPPVDSAVGRAASCLGLATLRLEDFEAARSWLEISLRHLRLAFAEESADVAYPRSVLGECLTRLERFEEAERHLVASYEILLDTHGPSRGTTRDVLERLIALYEAWNKEETAQEYRRTLEEAISGSSS